MKILTVLLAVALVGALAADLALVQPKEVAEQVAAKGAHPAIFQVGPAMLYRAKHIPGALYAGPASKPEGLELLKQAAAKLPRDREIVLYCGCCPWANCPNVKPAVETLRAMGFAHVKAMFVGTNFATDWTQKGYPVEAGGQ
jgi:rhodanese-related sulfurtransferase